MKLTIEKLPGGKLRVTVASDTAKKPIAFDVAADQLESLLRMLQMAGRSDTFKFSVEF